MPPGQAPPGARLTALPAPPPTPALDSPTPKMILRQLASVEEEGKQSSVSHWTRSQEAHLLRSRPVLSPRQRDGYAHVRVREANESARSRGYGPRRQQDWDRPGAVRLIRAEDRRDQGLEVTGSAQAMGWLQGLGPPTLTALPAWLDQAQVTSSHKNLPT